MTTFLLYISSFLVVTTPNFLCFEFPILWFFNFLGWILIFFCFIVENETPPTNKVKSQKKDNTKKTISPIKKEIKKEGSLMKTKVFLKNKITDAFKTIANLDPDGKHWINVFYSNGIFISFNVGYHLRNRDFLALNRHHPDDILRTRSLKFKTHITVKNQLVKEGRGAEIIKIILDPSAEDLDFNQKKSA